MGRECEEAKRENGIKNREERRRKEKKRPKFQIIIVILVAMYCEFLN